MNRDLGASQDEGGAAMAKPEAAWPSLTGTESQVEWAQRIRVSVRDDFERVEKSFRSVADGQDASTRARTEAILAILRDKREDVMGRREAGYFIKEWQEISDQVRQAIRKDARFQAVRAATLKPVDR